MPWGIFAERQKMKHVFWYEPQGDLSEAAVYHYFMKEANKEPDPSTIIRLSHGRKRIIERFMLPNGIHYGLIQDAQTGDQVLSSSEFIGSMNSEDRIVAVSSEPKIIRGTDLGNGHLLQMFVTYRADQVPSGKDACTSYVKKTKGRKISGQEEFEKFEHELYYDIDPLRQTLRLGYDYQSDLQYSHIVLRPYIEPDWGNGHEVVFGVNTPNGENNGLFELKFDQKGRLRYISVSGKQNILFSGVVAPGITYAFKGPRQYTDYHGSQLFTREIHNALTMIFGIEFEDPLTLNLRVSTNNMFKNIDAQKTEDPRLMLVFKNSTPLVSAPRELPSLK